MEKNIVFPQVTPAGTINFSQRMLRALFEGVIYSRANTIHFSAWSHALFSIRGLYITTDKRYGADSSWGQIYTIPLVHEASVDTTWEWALFNVQLLLYFLIS